MKFKLRDYQRTFCRKFMDAMQDGVDGQRFSKFLGVAGTGSGKTIMGAAVLEYINKWAKRPGRGLFLGDTDELVAQTLDKIERCTGIIPDMEKAKSRASREADVVVGSIQTMSRRLEDWDPAHFALVIADEAHLSMAPMWQKTLEHFRIGGAAILGLTATPGRGDNKRLMDYYEHLVDEIPMKLLIEKRQLSPIVVQTEPLNIPIHSAVTDDDSDDIAAELEPYHQAIIDSIERQAGDRRKILIFHTSIPASRHFAGLLRARGHAAAHVDGTSNDRTQTIDNFHKPDGIRILNNVQLLTKGFDCPAVDCIIVLRPVKSRTAYVQMVGRGTRLFCPHGCDNWCDHPDRKQDMLLLDYLWDFSDKGVMNPANVFAEAPEQVASVYDELRKGAGKKIDLMLLDVEKFSDRERDLLERLRKSAGRKGERLDAREFSALLHQPDLMDYKPIAKWEHQKLTAKQEAMLAKVGAGASCRGEANQLITHLLHRLETKLATPNQVRALVAQGVKDAHLFTFDQANDHMNRRRRPSTYA